MYVAPRRWVPKLLISNQQFKLQVAIIYHSSKDAEGIASQIEAAHSITAAAYKANVSDQKDIEAAIQQITRDFGKVDILIANSGIATAISAEDYKPEEWQEIMKVNLDGAFYSAQAAARLFKTQGFGNVIFTASVSASLVNIPQKQAAVSMVFTRRTGGVA